MLTSIAHWLQHLSLIMWLGSSDYAYPFVQFTHFSGLSIWIATSLILDLRLIGFGKALMTPAKLLDVVFVWNWVGLAIAITGGFTLFCIAAGGYIVNPAFEVKIFMLVPVALIWHIMVQRMTRRRWGLTDEPPGVAKVAGGIELILWLCVITVAVSIPNY